MTNDEMLRATNNEDLIASSVAAEKLENTKESVDAILKSNGVQLDIVEGRLVAYMINPAWEKGNDKPFLLFSGPLDNTPF